MNYKFLLNSTAKTLLTLTTILLLYLPSLAQAQPAISGTVVDSLNTEPVIGATVLVEGTAIGTQTDMKGQFNLPVNKGEILLIRSVGYNEKRIVVGHEISVLIRLSAALQNLKEVVVLAYGSQLKADITAAVSQVDLTKSQGIPASNVGRLLQGQSPGVVVKQVSGQPGQELLVEIRGNSSLGATSDPLYVVDGFPLGTSVGNFLNANDIESITVLKDAASTSVYGSRGANGVVLITTKGGKKERNKLSVTTNTGFAHVPDSRRAHMLNGPDFVQFKKEIYSDNIRYFQHREPLLNEIPEKYRYPERTAVSTDWYKEILNQNALFNDLNVSLTNGSEKSGSYISMGYLSQQGSLINTGFNRVTARANLDSRPNKVVNFGVHLSGAYSWAKNSDAISGGFGNNIVVQSLLMDPTEAVYKADGSFNNYVGGHDNLFGFPNPVQRLWEELHKEYKTNLTANSYIEIKPIKNLTFRTNLNGMFDARRNHDFTPSGIAEFNNRPPRIASGGEYFYNNLNYGMDNLIIYTPEIKDHELEVTLGHIAQKNTRNTGKATGSQYPDDLVEYVSAANQRDGSSGMAEFTLESFLSRVRYSYKGKYLFTAAFNREASSRFGIKNRWGSFPSASVGWRLSQEEFFPKTDWLDDLKLRASYGITGNNNIGNYTSKANINTSNYVIGNTVVAGATVGAFPNPNLGWEQSRQLDIGMDLSLLRGKISLTAELYEKLTTDMLLEVEVPAVAGFNKIITNIGKLQNKGLEFGANYREKYGDLSFNAGFNISFNRGKILAIDGDRNFLLTGAFYDGFNISQVGEPIGMFYGFRVLGIYQNQSQIDATPHNPNHIPGTYQYLDGNGDGVISYDTRDMVVTGNPNPKFTWGGNWSVGYKRFDLSMLLNGSYGAQVFRAVELQLANIDGVFNVLADVKDRWKSEQNPGTGKWPGSNTYFFTREASSKYLYNGTYTWIKNITLGYTIPRIKNIIDAKVFLSVDNAFLLTTYPGNNPEVNGARADNPENVISPGIDRESYPVPRTISIGTKINF